MTKFRPAFFVVLFALSLFCLTARAAMNDVFRVSAEGGTAMEVAADRYTNEYFSSASSDSLRMRRIHIVARYLSRLALSLVLVLLCGSLKLVRAQSVEVSTLRLPEGVNDIVWDTFPVCISLSTNIVLG